MTFQNKIAVVTGGAQGIGKAIANAFQREGATVEIIDIQKGDYFVGDISKKETLEQFAEYLIQKHGHVDYLVVP